MGGPRRFCVYPPSPAMVLRPGVVATVVTSRMRVVRVETFNLAGAQAETGRLVAAVESPSHVVPRA